MREEARLEERDGGLVPVGPGWFILNTREAVWKTGDFGAYTRFEGDSRFPQVGFNIGVLEPGQAACYYHGEAEQEDFLVVSGECLLLVEGEERQVKAWDFVHMPEWTEHVFVGAGDGPCTLIAVGARTGGDVVYPDSELAKRHGAGAQRETRSPEEAYADIGPDTPTRCRDDWLP